MRSYDFNVTGETFHVIIDNVNGEVLEVAPEAILSDTSTPSTYKEAINSPNSRRWIESMSKEITDLKKNETWEYVRRRDVPKTHRVTKSKWVYKINLNKDGSIERFKSRFVACGYSQVKDVDYTESFSATLRASSLRMLLALASIEKLRLEHFDVTNAFTQASIDNEIYVEPPRGFETKDKEGNELVLKLRKALYGTKQASRMWQLKLRSHLVDKMGFNNSNNDPCLFSRRWDDGSVILIGIYVDDIVCAHKGSKFDWFKHEFTGPTGFRASHLGPLSWFLGISINQDDDFTVKCNQDQYVSKLLEKFVPVLPTSLIKHSMPCNESTFDRLSTAKNDKEREKAKALPYLQLIGSLLYLSTMTRPDIAYHLSILCSFMHDPSPACYHAAIDILLYVYATRNLSLHFPGSVKTPLGVDPKLHASIETSNGLIAYSDSSWRKPNELGFNMFGYVIYYGGAPVSYVAKHLKVIALSSAEAEYAAASYACKEITFVRKVLVDLGYVCNGPTVLAVDNEAALKIVTNLGVTARNKHFADALHYFRHLVDHLVVKPTFVRTTMQRADGFTKPLGKTLFRPWVASLGLK